MTYQLRNESVQDGDPVYRFVFVMGSTTYAYTTENYIVADSNYTYNPAPIKTGEFSQTGEMAKDPLSIELPRDHELAILFLGGVPEQITTITVYRGHVGDTDEEFQTYWKGRVAGASAGETVRLDCENVFTSLRRPGLRARYQYSCRHALYQSGCTLTASDWGVSATITAVSSFDVTVDILDSDVVDSNYADSDYFVGGYLETNDGLTRYITAQSGTTLTLIRPLASLNDDVGDSVGGAEVTLYPGCAKTRAVCKDKFNNLNNFGGFPFIPGETNNPFSNKITGSIA